MEHWEYVKSTIEAMKNRKSTDNHNLALQQLYNCFEDDNITLKDLDFYSVLDLDMGDLERLQKPEFVRSIQKGEIPKASSAFTKSLMSLMLYSQYQIQIEDLDFLYQAWKQIKKDQKGYMARRIFRFTSLLLIWWNSGKLMKKSPEKAVELKKRLQDICMEAAKETIEKHWYMEITFLFEEMLDRKEEKQKAIYEYLELLKNNGIRPDLMIGKRTDLLMEQHAGFMKNEEEEYGWITSLVYELMDHVVLAHDFFDDVDIEENGPLPAFGVSHGTINFEKMDTYQEYGNPFAGNTRILGFYKMILDIQNEKLLHDILYTGFFPGTDLWMIEKYCREKNYIDLWNIMVMYKNEIGGEKE